MIFLQRIQIQFLCVCEGGGGGGEGGARVSEFCLQRLQI